jgi:SpoVK/Ycf46/Vps4 family AAA+-type ATPase
VLTGQSLGAVSASVDLATALQPAMVVLEDVDLVAMDRSHVPTNAILFELLNAMDGLDEDHDLLFVLTTNRPDLLEPALAARPGRIDQAVLLPLPDADGRRRLLELVADLERTSPAFIRELLRRAALEAAEQSGDGALQVSDTHLRTALDELRRAGGELTQTLLGVDNAGSGTTDVSAHERPPSDVS